MARRHYADPVPVARRHAEPARPQPGRTRTSAISITGALDDLQSTQGNSDNLATQMATGQPTDVSDYMIAANQAEIATQLTVAVRNKAVDAFNQIMNMQV